MSTKFVLSGLSVAGLSVSGLICSTSESHCFCFAFKELREFSSPLKLLLELTSAGGGRMSDILLSPCRLWSEYFTTMIEELLDSQLQEDEGRDCRGDSFKATDGESKTSSKSDSAKALPDRILPLVEGTLRSACDGWRTLSTASSWAKIMFLFNSVWGVSPVKLVCTVELFKTESVCDFRGVVGLSVLCWLKCSGWDWVKLKCKAAESSSWGEL